MKTFDFSSINEVKEFAISNNGNYIIRKKGNQTTYSNTNNPFISLIDQHSNCEFGNDDTEFFSYKEFVDFIRRQHDDKDDNLRFYISILLDFRSQLKKELISENELIIIQDGCSYEITPDNVLSYEDDNNLYEMGVEY